MIYGYCASMILKVSYFSCGIPPRVMSGDRIYLVSMEAGAWEGGCWSLNNNITMASLHVSILYEVVRYYSRQTDLDPSYYTFF